MYIVVFVVGWLLCVLLRGFSSVACCVGLVDAWVWLWGFLCEETLLAHQSIEVTHIGTGKSEKRSIQTCPIVDVWSGVQRQTVV